MTDQTEPRRARAAAAQPDPATESLWAEHGWTLSGRDVAILLIAVSVASMCLGLLG